MPPILQPYFGAPYIYGPEVVSILENGGGNNAIDTALTGPTPTTRIYLDPTAVNQVADTPPPVPSLQAGETKLSTETASDEDFDDFTLYLMLGARLDPITALRAADAYKAGSSTSYTTSGGKTCFRASVTGVNPASDAFLARVIGDWTKKMPDAAVESTSGLLTWHSCDPGKHAVAPTTAAIRAVTTLAATRDQLTENFITHSRVDDALAACAARVIMQLPNPEAVILPRSPAAVAAAQQAGARAGLACRHNPLAGIP